MTRTQPPAPLPLAIALEYDGTGAPRVTAKGAGDVARRIVETAREYDVPVEQNHLLAQALSKVELDEQIPEELYRATAQIIAFVLALRDDPLYRRHRDAHPR